MRNKTALFALLAITSAGAFAACGDTPGTGADAGADATPTTTVPTVTPPGDASPDVVDPPKPGVAAGPSRGSAVALSWDDKVLVSVNRDVGSVTVFSVAYTTDGKPPTLTKKAEVPVGKEPWQVAISPDNDTAFVVLREEQKLVRISGLSSTPTVKGTVAVGSEPTAVALSPTGKTAYVANWVDGTVTAVDTAGMTVKKTIDLNAALIATGFLGAGVTSRPGLAHPRSIAVTNNNNENDDDENLYVTEYFGQRTAPESSASPGNAAAMDTNHDGVVYKVNVGDGAVSTIRLGAIADTGFKDSATNTAGCFPNQLQSITIAGKFAYVSHVCASPRGPTGGVVEANFKTTTHGAVSVIDIAKGTEVKAGTSSLHQKMEARFNTGTPTPDNARKYPAVPTDMAFVKDTSVGYVAANAIDAVFRARYDDTGSFAEAGTAAGNPFIDTNPAGIPAAGSGKNPIGVATANTDANKRFMFVVNDVSRNVQVIDLNTQAVAGGAATPTFAESAAQPAAGSPAEHVLKGKRFFNTGAGRWSFKGQGWGACQSCHIDGLTDNVTWSFARGPRQTVSLDGSFSKKDPTDQRIFNWTAIFDEVSDFEGNTQGVSGGVGAIVSKASAPIDNADRIPLGAVPVGAGTENHGALSGSSTAVADKGNPLGLTAPSILSDWAEITDYVKTVRSPKGVSGLDAAKVATGKNLFTNDGNCQGCHGGDKWTISKRFYDPSLATTNALRGTAWTAPGGFPAALLPTESGTGAMRLDPASLPDATTIGNFDQLLCILRPVGTFGVADAISGVSEFRQSSTAATPVAAQGNQAFGRGFNPPSLLSIAAGAPYLHAGNAATLESLFSVTFKSHYQALAPNFLTETDPVARAKVVEALVQYLLSIDNTTATVAIPTPGATGGDFCAAP
ncbi:MAG: hypothetical protein IPQ09_26880 [Myxococcales bacterium]|nr:hypothetical protein [Myxococcales bacterium]